MPAGRIHRVRGGLSKKAVVKIVDKRLIQKAETKIVERSDTLDSSAEITVNTPFEWSDLFNFAIAEGTGENERIGDELDLLSMNVSVLMDGSTYFYRMVVVYFPDNDGVGWETGLTYGSFLPKKEDVDFRYKVLLDRNFDTNASTGGTIKRSYKLKIPVKGLRIQYDAGATTINRGAVRCILLTDSSVAGFGTDLKAIARIRYKDM